MMPGNAATAAGMLPPESFVEEVRAALDHLYDYAFLHNHSLTCGCAAKGALMVLPVSSGGTLLLDSIENLRPAQPRWAGRR